MSNKQDGIDRAMKKAFDLLQEPDSKPDQPSAAELPEFGKRVVWSGQEYAAIPASDLPQVVEAYENWRKVTATLGPDVTAEQVIALIDRVEELIVSACRFIPDGATALSELEVALAEIDAAKAGKP